jgi:hypothetical protein
MEQLLYELIFFLRVYLQICPYIDFGMQAVALDGEERETEDDVKDWIDLLVDNGVSIVSPPQQHLVEPDVTSEFRMKPSFYANYANENGIGIIAWSSDRTVR